MRKEIGFGVIGLGMGANRCEMVSQTPGAKLVAVADINEERANEIASKYKIDYYTDYHKMLSRDDIEVIYVMTPSGMHSKMTMEAAKRGKNVITTKPVEVTLEKADEMIKECKTQGVKLAVDFESRYIRDNIRIYQAIQNKNFGKLILGEVRLKWYRSQQYYEGWHGTWKLDGGGSLINQTIHQIDLLRWFVGPVKKVFGQIGIFSHKIETEDLGIGILNFENGALGTILGTTTYFEDSPPFIEIHGDKGGVKTEGNKVKFWKIAGEEEPFKEESFPHNVVEDMLQAIREDKEPWVNGEEGRKSLELVMGIYESSRKGKIINFLY